MDNKIHYVDSEFLFSWIISKFHKRHSCSGQISYRGYFMEATKTIASMPPAHCPLLIAWVPSRNLQLLIGCSLPRRQCLGALALSKTKQCLKDVKVASILISA